MKNLNLDDYFIISYLRVSDPHQVGGDGFERQRDTIRGWMRSQAGNNVTVEIEFPEEGFTGTDFNRPALTRLLEYCSDHHERQTGAMQEAIKNPNNLDKVQGNVLLLVERSDRLARDNLVAELILQECRKLDVTVIDCEADLDLCEDNDPSKVLIRQILQAVAQFDKSSIVQKLRKARDRKRARGERCEGAKPFGHYPDEELALAMIKQLAMEGHKPLEIAEEMNEGIDQGKGFLKPRRGSRWNRGTIHRILKAQVRD